MDYNQLAYFVTLVEAGSLSEAARRLNVAKSSISRALVSLEENLGMQLAYRNTRHFRPNEAGLDLYKRCKGPLFDIKVATENIQKEESSLSGRFILTAAIDVAQTILPAIISEFSKQYPNLQIEIRAEDKMVDLVKEGVDLALRMGELTSSNLKSLKISEVRLVLVATPSYVNNNPKIKSPEDFKNHRLVCFNQKFEKSLLLSKKNQKDITVKVNSRLIANSPIVAKYMIMESQSLGLLPDVICAEELKMGQLVRVLPEYYVKATPFSYVWPTQSTESTKVRAFINFTKDRFKKRLELA